MAAHERLDAVAAVEANRELARHAAHSDDLPHRSDVDAVDEFGLPVKPFKPILYDDHDSSDGYESACEEEGEEEEEEKRDEGSSEQCDAAGDESIAPPADVQIRAEQNGEHDSAREDTVAACAEKDNSSDEVAPRDTPSPPEQPSNHSALEKSEKNGEPVTDVTSTAHSKKQSLSERMVLPEHLDAPLPLHGTSEWSHQLLVPQENAAAVGTTAEEDIEWQDMPAVAPYDIYDDDGKLVAREAHDSDDEAAYRGRGGAGKGYTKINVDEDAQSATSMDENTRYLFKESGTHLADEDNDEAARDPLTQLQTTKELLTEQQRVAYVALVRVATVLMLKALEDIEGTKSTKKMLLQATESMRQWSQKMMVRLYAHMDISANEQVMIEQLAEHGVEPGDLTPTLLQNARVKNPMARKSQSSASLHSPPPYATPPSGSSDLPTTAPVADSPTPPPPPYEAHNIDSLHDVQDSQLPETENLDIDIRWTILCDLFLLLVADSGYDARSRVLLERVGEFLGVPWLDIYKFEKRVTDALEMQEAADKENWNEEEHMENRRKMAVRRRMVMMGLATVGGGLVIGLSAGLLAPVIGAGLAAGFTTIGVAGTSGFFAGAGGAAMITTTGLLTGGAIGIRSSSRRMGPVKTFEYRPLHNNKRVNLIVTIPGWMNGKVDDVRLPYSTVDPIMGDLYSVLWEPEMLQSMGQTINILATEALTQGLQQVLGSTILVALMASLQLPIVLTKLSYLIDNPWTVSLDRANAAGLILADSLIDRNLGARPATLVGFSLGSRVIFSCLRELANKGAVGLVQNVYMFGSPVVAKTDEYTRARGVVAGKFVNGYATNDWILGYLFRATSGGIMRVAGLAPINDVPGLENVDVTALVPGHMAYRTAMPRLLREAGWTVSGDEFVEIEDPDPDNHAQRQREIIAELDEARKELAKEPKKRRFGFFTKNKKLAAKKEWEMYSEDAAKQQQQQQQQQEGRSSASPAPETNGTEKSAFFDVDAIRAELASEQIQIKEIKSTLPPMRLDISCNAGMDSAKSSTDMSSSATKPTKSIQDGLAVRPKEEPILPSPSLVYSNPSLARRSESGSNWTDPAYVPFSSKPASLTTPSPPPPHPPSNGRNTPLPLRPSFQHTYSVPAGFGQLERDAWLNDDPGFGAEQEITLTFE